MAQAERSKNQKPTVLPSRPSEQDSLRSRPSVTSNTLHRVAYDG